MIPKMHPSRENRPIDRFVTTTQCLLVGLWLPLSAWFSSDADLDNEILTSVLILLSTALMFVLVLLPDFVSAWMIRLPHGLPGKAHVCPRCGFPTDRRPSASEFQTCPECDLSYHRGDALWALSFRFRVWKSRLGLIITIIAAAGIFWMLI